MQHLGILTSNLEEKYDLEVNKAKIARMLKHLTLLVALWQWSQTAAVTQPWVVIDIFFLKEKE